MSVKYNWIGICALVMSSVAWAAQDTPIGAENRIARTDAEKLVAQQEGEKLMALGNQEMDRQELATAIKFYVQAAELNYIPAQVKLGEMADFSQFYETAVGWYLMAAMQGDAAGQFLLGKMYLVGNGIEKDESKAAFWFRRAAAKNYAPAAIIFADAYKTGAMGLKVDTEQAKIWDERAKVLTEKETREINKKIAESTEAKKKLAEQEAEQRKKLIEDAKK